MFFLLSLVDQPRNEMNFSVFFADYTDFSLLWGTFLAKPK